MKTLLLGVIFRHPLLVHTTRICAETEHFKTEFHNAVHFLPIKGFDPAQKLLIVSAVDKDLCVVLD